MKILVLSDTHGKLDYAEKAIERLLGRVSAAIHLGDMLSDARILEAEYDVPFYYVAGNCDYYYSAEDEMPESLIIEINGVKILLTHGHADGVKHGYDRLSERARKKGADIALCGHSHEPFNKIVNGVLCVNPGSISYPRRSARHPSYAVLDIPEGEAKQPSAGIVEMN